MGHGNSILKKISISPSSSSLLSHPGNNNDNDNDMKNNDEEEETPIDNNFLNRCKICKNDFKYKKNEILKDTYCYIENCGHIFCYHCILKWRRLTNRCPICRLPFHNVCSLNTENA